MGCETSQRNIPRPLFLLILLAADKGAPIIGRLKLEKLLFKVQKDLLDKNPMLPRYNFRPYKYGPYTEDAYDDLEALKELDLAKEKDSVFEITQKGIDLLEELEKKGVLDKDLIEKIEDIKRKYNKLDTDQLLTIIYSEYPDYATRSEIRELLKRR
ncbi:MAG: DUF4065 domain-containing protein [Candidatus Methanomethylicaceae archaeon]